MHISHTGHTKRYNIRGHSALVVQAEGLGPDREAQAPGQIVAELLAHKILFAAADASAQVAGGARVYVIGEPPLSYHLRRRGIDSPPRTEFAMLDTLPPAARAWRAATSAQSRGPPSTSA